MKMFKWSTWVISELFYGYTDINCLNKFEVENECKLDISTVSYLWQLGGADVSALRWNTLRQAQVKKKKKKSRICSDSSVKQTCILKETERLVLGMIVLNECPRSSVFYLLCFSRKVQVEQIRIGFAMETCSFVKPSQAVQITTFDAVANHVRFFSSSSTWRGK